MRLDKFLAEKKLAPSRSKAEDWIRNSLVQLRIQGEWRTMTQTSHELEEDFPTERIRIAETNLTALVSRAGAKLAAFLESRPPSEFFNFKNTFCLDVGQSTGGFTEVLLARGAAKVIGIEVGHSQLHPRLKADPRVICLEHTHVGHLAENQIFQTLRPTRGFEWIVVDVSFISLTQVLPALQTLGRKIIFLIKPQFESEKKVLSFSGAITKVSSCFQTYGGIIHFEGPSPIGGRDGNQEYFVAGTLAHSVAGTSAHDDGVPNNDSDDSNLSSTE